MDVANDRIYVLTYKQQKGETECIIMDLKGKEIKRVFVLLPDYPPLRSPVYSINNHRFYTLKENIATETLELLIKDMK
jgi:hypothetical protein